MTSDYRSTRRKANSISENLSAHNVTEKIHARDYFTNEKILRELLARTKNIASVVNENCIYELYIQFDYSEKTHCIIIVKRTSDTLQTLHTELVLKKFTSEILAIALSILANVIR